MSFEGWQRLQTAEQVSAQKNNAGLPYTLEQLSLITGLSTNTLTKVRRRQKPVDVSTVEIYFQAFDLVPTAEDWVEPSLAKGEEASYLSIQDQPFRGPLPFDSPFYIYRSPIEKSCFGEVLNPGALVRIKAPRQFGKTSLITLLLEYGKSQEFRVAVVNLRLIDRAFLQTTNQFLQWFCALVARSLDLPNELDTRWDDLFGGSYSCTDYFETYLLPAGDRPLLLLIDGVDELFPYPEVAIDFFGMLRAWYEQGSYGGVHAIWQRLRLVLTHSMEAGLTFSPHQSPFNVGVSLLLPPFNLMQIQELAFRYGLEPSQTYATCLGQLLGGHPYLTQLSLFHLSQSGQKLADFTAQATTYTSIFSPHLRRQGALLEADPELATAVEQLLPHPKGVKLPPGIAFRLQGVGWVRFEEQRSLISCDLYRRYFASVLEV